MAVSISTLQGQNHILRCIWRSSEAKSLSSILRHMKETTALMQVELTTVCTKVLQTYSSIERRAYMDAQDSLKWNKRMRWKATEPHFILGCTRSTVQYWQSSHKASVRDIFPERLCWAQITLESLQGYQMPSLCKWIPFCYLKPGWTATAANFCIM